MAKEFKKAKVIEFDYDGNHYVLEFNRKAIQRLEEGGFVIGEMAEKPFTRIPELFYGALQMHHKNIRREYADEMLDHFDKTALASKLTEMYADVLESFLSVNGEDDEKNIVWEANW